MDELYLPHFVHVETGTERVNDLAMVPHQEEARLPDSGPKAFQSHLSQVIMTGWVTLSFASGLQFLPSQG